MANISDDPTEREYHLIVKSKFYRKTVNETIQGHAKSYERELVLFVPEESDQRTRFFMAWLPDSGAEYFELGGYIASPIDSPCRLSIHRGPDEKSERHYLFCMSKGVEEIILTRPEGSTFRLTIMPASQEAEGDFDQVDSQFSHEAISEKSP